LDYALALASGVLLALSFPRFGHPAFAWISIAPLLIALAGWRPGGAAGQRPSRAFALGLVSGTVYFVGTVYWTGTVVRTFGGLALPVAIFAMLLLSAYLALYPAIAALIVSRVINRAGVNGLLIAPAAWVATEFARGLTGSSSTGFAFVKPSRNAREPAILKLASSESTSWNLPS